MGRVRIHVYTATVLSSFVVQGSTLPFDRYPAHAHFSGRPAAVDLSSDAGARRFRTVLREGARAGPNFAGAFTVVTWGCGSNCLQLAVVGARNGSVYFFPETIDFDVHYRRGSELLVVDPYACGFTEDELPGARWRMYYRWTGRQFVFIDSVRIPAGAAC